MLSLIKIGANAKSALFIIGYDHAVRDVDAWTHIFTAGAYLR